MQMGMMSESLSPRVQNTEETDLSSEMFGVEPDRQKGFCRSAEQQTIHLAFVL